MSYEYTYCAPTGGLPDQNNHARERAVFTNSYAVIPHGVMSDIVVSYLPGWDKPVTGLWPVRSPVLPKPSRS